MPARLAALAALAPLLALPAAQPPGPAAGLRFVVTLDPAQAGPRPESGRVLVAVAPAGRAPDFTNYRPPTSTVLGADADAWAPGRPVTLDAKSDVFPSAPLNDLPAGTYRVQAVFATNPDVNLPDAPGNRFCDPVTVRLDPAAGTAVTLNLDKAYREAVPKETPTRKYLKIPSKLLSDFHGRPVTYRVGVVLPDNFPNEPDRRYGLVVAVGGFGTRYTSAEYLPADPRFVQVVPDGAGPLGDPYQVNSANNGPYGDALVREVIPFVEKAYRCVGTPKARFAHGASTGGWVSLALQLFYPDEFNGCWAQCPDSVTFERFELIDLYADANAFRNRSGFDRPGTRTFDGDTVSTVRHEVALERVLGRGGRWELGGRDWASWNAVYGPRGKDGRPVPVWDGKTGAIDRGVVEHWKKYDLVKLLERDWPTLGPKLAGGKVNVWVGEADDYFLNAAVRRLKRSVAGLKNPAFDGRVLVEAERSHVEGGWTRKEMLDAMAARAGLR